MYFLANYNLRDPTKEWSSRAMPHPFQTDPLLYGAGTAHSRKKEGGLGVFPRRSGFPGRHSFFRPQKKKIDDGNEQMNNEIHIQQSASLPPQIYHTNASLQKNDNPAQRRVHSKLTQHPTKLGTPSSGDHRNAQHKCNFS